MDAEGERWVETNKMYVYGRVFFKRITWVLKYDVGVLDSHIMCMEEYILREVNSLNWFSGYRDCKILVSMLLIASFGSL